MKCPECGYERFNFEPRPNEQGWHCLQCEHQPGEPPGFCPELDRYHTADKVETLLMCLSGQLYSNVEFVSVSNSDHGCWIVDTVIKRCRDIGKFDQYTICQFIFESLSSHGDYWKKIVDGVLAGNDPRERCHCGALATCYRAGSGTCAKHAAKMFEDASA